MSRNLILYYSRTGENYVNGSIRSLAVGNTARCAEFIRDAVGGDLFEVRTAVPYSADYNECTRQANEELKANARPQLQAYPGDISGYDNIFVLGPCWWGTYPMAVFAALEGLDVTGKKILPLMTHEGSGMGSAERDLHRLCPGAVFGTGMAVHGADAAQSRQAVAAWAKKNLEVRA